MIGYDIMDIGEDFLGIQILFDVMRFFVFLLGIIYYSNVQVYGFSDIYYIELFDGFKLDKYKFVEGIVFDGIGMKVVQF